MKPKQNSYGARIELWFARASWVPLGRLGARLATAGVVALSIFLNGCLSRPALVSQSFNFASPTIGSKQSPHQGPVLSIHRLTIAAAYQGQSFVYRTGEFSYETDPYAQFVVPPDEGLKQPLEAYLRAGGLFRNVVEPDSALQPDTLVEISVERLCGDFQRRTNPSAELELRFTFFDAPSGAARKVILDKDYSERIPLKSRTAEALMAGWNTGLSQIMRRLAEDLKAQNPNIAISKSSEAR